MILFWDTGTPKPEEWSAGKFLMLAYALVGKKTEEYVFVNKLYFFSSAESKKFISEMLNQKCDSLLAIYFSIYF